MTVYIDIILLENLYMNYIILFATGYIMKIKMKQWRLFFSALLGSIYAITSYLKILPIYTSFMMKIIISTIMVYVAYQAEKAKKLASQLIIFYLTSFAFGGCAFALLYFVKPQNIFIKDGVYIGTYPIKIALLGGLVGFIIMQIAFKIVKTKLKPKDMIYKITIKIQEKQVSIPAILDTGNFLKDPITQIPVVIVEKDKLYSILPNKLLDNIEKIIGGEKTEFLKEIDSKEYLTKLRIIPFSSIGKLNGLMLGIKADLIIIEKEGEKEERDNAIIGIFSQKLGNYYSALFGLELLEGRENNEFVTNIKE